MTSNLQELREIIITANYPDYDNYEEYVRDNFRLEDRREWLEEDEELQQLKCLANEKPITLAHVLIALGKVKNLSVYEMGFCDTRFDLCGKGGLYMECFDGKEVRVIWDLTKDLDSQAPEVIISLIKLLKESDA